ncbi:MAG: hypothetical protein Q9M91_06815 [Candidatus Dojkabacteria bacterium]|nr:hypothetical protein [Candidatus Dojkabacteria bacterium]
MSSKEFLNLFRNYPDNVVVQLTNKLIDIPCSRIEDKIEKTQIYRKEKPEKANKVAYALHGKTIADLKEVRNVIGEEHIRYQILRDKLVEEILQCSIEFFNIFREEDSDYDPGEEALKIATIAQSFGVTGRLENRLEENLSIIQDWVDRAPNKRII